MSAKMKIEYLTKVERFVAEFDCDIAADVVDDGPVTIVRGRLLERLIALRERVAGK